MAAPRSAPAGARESRYYTSPDVVPGAWKPERPGVVEGQQPVGPGLGTQGPDQGFALALARRLAPKLHLDERERLEDVIRGCVGIALRRASLFGRAPVIHDLTVAFTIWEFFEEQPRDDLLERRIELFEGVGNVHHHYAEGRVIADMVPESTLRMSPQQVTSTHPAIWRELTGA